MVTGGAGFIGSHVVDLLIQQGYCVIVVDDLSGGKKEHVNREALFYQVDINDPGLEKIFQEEGPDYVCHLAAQISVSYSVGHPRIDAQKNIMGLLNMLDCARKSQVKGIVFSSSGGTIYGEPDTFPVSESCPFAPSSPYGIAKMTSEYYLDFYYRFYGLNYVSLRFANVYGPRQDPFGEAGVISIFTQKMLNGEAP
ncbi:MAG: NAD-dependent epimerase/dehydratase family protein, partial [Candidatus Aminicenantes bacterium]|nr:NAD-dependent epimerase/dehydratase family protein [Candidatus Aminicenantes bacterium]